MDEIFSFEKVTQDNPIINLQGLKDPYEIQKEPELIELFNKSVGALLYVNSKVLFDENTALSILLRHDIVFLNDHWWMSANQNKDRSLVVDPWPESACKTFSIIVACNDTFGYATADGEECFYADLESLYAHYFVDPEYGPTVWCAKKRGYLPLKELCEEIKAAGIWDLDSLHLK